MERASSDSRRAHRHSANGVAGGNVSSRDGGSPGVGSRGTSRSASSRMSMSSGQKRRMRRTQESARELRERQSRPRSMIPVQVREPDYWRDISVEIAGTIVSAMLIFGFGHIFGYIEHPTGRSELPRLLGLLATLSVLVFVFVRIRRVRADHPGASRARLVGAYLRAIRLHVSLPTLVLGVLLSLGFF